MNVCNYGDVYYTDWYKVYPRPAFQLLEDAILFESTAVGGKPAVNSGFTAYSAPTRDIDRKLTLLDDDRHLTATSTDTVVYPGGQVNIAYRNATLGTNEYVSAMLCDSEGTPLYYASATPTSGTGTWALKLPVALDEGSYTLKVFSEQRQGDEMTDYASAMSTIAITVQLPDFGTPDFTLPADITAIEKSAFEGAAMTVVSIPKGCERNGFGPLALPDFSSFPTLYHVL